MIKSMNFVSHASFYEFLFVPRQRRLSLGLSDLHTSGDKRRDLSACFCFACDHISLVTRLYGQCVRIMLSST